MASVIQGYEYDIFISYRQKDNRHDAWVTHFVENLKDELESTFKEPISLYFDVNPTDGLLETHEVGDSLKDKLRCLIFIPIISRTYCDPKSFAWQHEFEAFIKEASADRFGLKVKLPNGNIASRVLPVKIHSLEPDDIALCESATGGVLRGVELIYSEPGVNRPLMPSDSDEKNLNKTNYRNQVNKVALSIKDIIAGLQGSLNTTTTNEVTEPVQKKYLANSSVPKFINTKKFRVLSGILLLGMIIAASLFIYSKISGKNSNPSDNRLSIAVMPFENIAKDTSLYIFENSIQDIIVTILSDKSADLKVRQSGSVNTLLKNKGVVNAGITPLIAADISQLLDAEIFVSGSIIKIGNILRLSAKLTDTKVQEVFKSFQVDFPAENKNIIRPIDSLSNEIKQYLLLSKIKKDLRIPRTQSLATNSVDAFRDMQAGSAAFNKREYSLAARYFSRAYDTDTNFISAGLMLSQAYYNDAKANSDRESMMRSKEAISRLYRKKESMAERHKLRTERIYAEIFLTPEDVINCVRKIISEDEKNPSAYYELGYYNLLIGNNNNAIAALERSLDIYDEWRMKPVWANNYYFLSMAYFNTGEYKKQRKLLKRADEDFPGDKRLALPHLQVAIMKKDTIEAKKYLDIWLATRTPDLAAYNAVSGFYALGGLTKPAITLWREALKVHPGDPDWMNNFAYFLIANDLNIHEGLELVEKALAVKPDDPYILDTKGWGLYKSGKYKEALEALEKSKNLFPPGRMEQLKTLEGHITAVKTAMNEK